MNRVKSGATIDETGRYRYTLWRSWDGRRKKLAFVMLNPSTADAVENDPTIRRCIAFARHLDYGRLEVVNLFAYRATKPEALRQVDDPVGPQNDDHLKQAAAGAHRVILAWGNHGLLKKRNRHVLSLLSEITTPFCLGITDLGQPRHPLYVKGDFKPIPFPLEAD